MSAMSRRRYFGGIAAVTGGLLAAACDLGAEPPATTRSKPAVTVRVLTTLNAVPEALDIIWQEIGTRFAEEQPHLTLERHDFGVLGAPWDPRPLHELIRELVAAGELADVFQTISTLTGLYFTEGALLGLSHYAKRDGYDLTDIRLQAPQFRYVAVEPARRSLATELADRYGAAALAALGYARHVPPHPRILELLQAYGQGLASIWTGEQTVEAATAGVSRRQNMILEEWRQKQGAP